MSYTRSVRAGLGQSMDTTILDKMDIPEPPAAPEGDSGDGWWDAIKSGVTGALDFYGEQKAAEARAEALKQQNAAMQAALSKKSGASPSNGGGFQQYLPWLAVGGAGLGLLFLLARRR